MEYFNEISGLPVPTQQQIDRFREHLQSAHSWYKRLPLFNGETFAVFLEPDLDRNYPRGKQIFPLFGDTKEEYKRAFGNLFYMYRDNDAWHQDYGECRNNIPEEFLEKWSFTLYPYCHYDFEEAITLFEDDFRKIASGVSYTNANLLINWRKRKLKRDNYWQNSLNDKERDDIISVDEPQELFESGKLTSPISKYFELEKQAREIEDYLRRIEQQKIENALKLMINDIKEIKKYFSTDKY